MKKNRLACGVATAIGLLVSTTAGAVPLLGVAGNQLIGFDSATPGTITGTRTISGLAVGETIVGIDTRPANGSLMLLGSTSRLYNVNLELGAAAPVGAGPFTPPLSGTSFGMDFNPTVDRVRVVSDTESNFRLHPDTGAVAATDTALNPAGNVVAAAYTNNFAGATSTTLYVIDSSTDTLYTQGSVNGTPTSPNSGTLFAVGALGVDFSATTSFDITSGGLAFASTTGQTGTQLYSINLTTGAATLIGPIAANVTSITGGAILLPFSPSIPAVPRTGLIGLALGLVAFGAIMLRRRRHAA